MDTIENRLQKEMISAMKEQNKIRLETIRGIKSAIQIAKTSKDFNGSLTDSDVIKIIQKLVKQRNESAEIYKNAGRHQLAESELKEAEIMSEFLPEQMTEDEISVEIDRIISESGASTIKDTGKVMASAKNFFAGRADNSVIGKIVREKLTKK